MASNAFEVHLDQLLLDARTQIAAWRFMRDHRAMTRAQREAFPRAAVVACLSAWESFLEELMREAVEAMRPPSPPLGAWSALNAHVMGLTNSFHTPNAPNTDRLIGNCLGLLNVRLSWHWHGMTAAQAAQRLADALDDRHEIAHGVNPRPVVPLQSADELILFLTRLAQRTDAAVRHHLVGVHSVASPWPA